KERLRLRENVAVEIVEAAHDLARELEMRSLILADRNEVRAIDDDVRGLQERIPQKSVGIEILLLQLLLLILEGRHALEPRQRRHHRKEEMQLGMLLHFRLHEDRGALRIETCGDPVRN